MKIYFPTAISLEYLSAHYSWKAIKVSNLHFFWIFVGSVQLEGYQSFPAQKAYVRPFSLPASSNNSCPKDLSLNYFCSMLFYILVCDKVQRL